MKNTSKIQELIYRQIIGNVTEEEERTIEDWISESESNSNVYKSLKDPRRIGQSLAAYGQIDLETAYQKVIPKKGKVVEMKSNWFRYAAAVMLLLLSGLVLYISKNTDSEPAEMITITAPYGQKRTVGLPDGSKVWVNAGSSISYQKEFDAEERYITMSGEVFFDVAKDKTRPFTVISGDLSTTALGTSFNIRSFPSESSSKVSLITGKVLVKNIRKSNSEIILNPGNQITLDKAEQTLESQQFDETHMIGWTKGIMSFEQSSLGEVIGELERWYGVQIELVDQPEAEWSYSGSFENRSLKTVLLNLSYSQEFEFSINEKHVQITFKEK